MRQSYPLLIPRYYPWHEVFAGRCQPLLGVGSSRCYLCESFSTCLDPYPGCSCGAHTRYFPQNYGLPGRLNRSALSVSILWQLQYGDYYGAAVILLCSGPQICLPPRLLLPQCFPALSSHGVYIRASHSLLPPCAPDMLTVRFGQLTVRGLAPLKIRSLTGCSQSQNPQSSTATPAVLCREANTLGVLNRPSQI